MKRTMNHCSHKEYRTEAFTARARTRACIVGMCVFTCDLIHALLHVCMCVRQRVCSGGSHETEDLDWKAGLLL